MKRLLCLIVSTVIFTSVFTLPALANSIKFSGSSTSCNPGETVTISFSVSSGLEIGAVDFTLSYDSTIFTDLEYETGYAFTGNGGFGTGNEISEGLFKYGFICAEGTKKVGEMFSVTFKVSNNAVRGKKYIFNLVVGSIVNSSTKKLTANNTSASVTIKSNSSASSISSRPSSSVSNNASSSITSNNSVNNNLNSQNSSSVTETSSFSEASKISSGTSSNNVNPGEFVPQEATYTDTNTVTGTNTDVNYLLNSKHLYTIIIALSALALSLLIIMITLIIKAYSTDKKEI